MGSEQMQGWTRRIGMEMEVNWNHRGLDNRTKDQFQGPRPWHISKELERAGRGCSPYEIEDRYAVDGACHFIREYFTSPFYERKLAHRPLLLKVSLNQPHYPFCCQKELIDKYEDLVPDPDLRPIHPHPALNGHPGPIDAPPAQVRRARAAYYGMIEQADRQFERVIKSLESTGQNLNNWVVVFTSDHGELLGDHHHWWKHKLLEKSVRVPLFIRTPTSKRNIDCDRVVSLCDLYATLCELAGVTVPPGLDSRSLIPLLNGDNTWGNIALSEVFGKYRMVVESHYKYVLSKDGDRALFDMTAALPEAENLLDQAPAHQTARRLQAMLDEIPWESSS
jgi:choline-sulfatase